MSDDGEAAGRSDDGADPPVDPAAELRAQIAATKANLAAAAEALAARMDAPPAAFERPVAPQTPQPRNDTLTAGASNLPVLYRPNDTRRAITIAGAVLGAVILAYQLSRRFRR